MHQAHITGICLFADSGELADLLDMPVPDLALKLIPAALPKLTEDQNTAALETLAHSVGYGLQQMMLDYGFHVVAKYLYGGGSALTLSSQCILMWRQVERVHGGHVASCHSLV